MRAMFTPARCPECAWSLDAPGQAPDQLVALVVALEGHLASTHDWTWQRAHEHARAWSRQVLSLPPEVVSPLQASRTIQCAACDWTERATSEDLLEISRCSNAFEAHLREAHGASADEAGQAAEGWALPLLHGRIK